MFLTHSILCLLVVSLSYIFSHFALPHHLYLGFSLRFILQYPVNYNYQWQESEASRPLLALPAQPTTHTFSRMVQFLYLTFNRYITAGWVNLLQGSKFSCLSLPLTPLYKVLISLQTMRTFDGNLQTSSF